MGLSMSRLLVLIILVAVVGIVGYFYISTKEGQMCGGFAGLSCPVGYSCQGMGNYPDASGICVPSLFGK